MTNTTEKTGKELFEEELKDILEGDNDYKQREKLLHSAGNYGLSQREAGDLIQAALNEHYGHINSEGIGDDGKDRTSYTNIIKSQRLAEQQPINKR
jgi:hypothetical protein